MHHEFKRPPYNVHQEPPVRVAEELVVLITEWRRGDRLEASFRAELVAAYASAAGWRGLATAADRLSERLLLRSAGTAETEAAAIQRLIALAKQHVGTVIVD